MSIFENIKKMSYVYQFFKSVFFIFQFTRGELQGRSTYIISYITYHYITHQFITLYTFNIGIWCVFGRFRRIGLVVAGRDILPYVMQAYYILIDSRPSIFVQCAKCRQRFVRQRGSDLYLDLYISWRVLLYRLYIYIEYTIIGIHTCMVVHGRRSKNMRVRSIKTYIIII